MAMEPAASALVCGCDASCGRTGQAIDVCELCVLGDCYNRPPKLRLRVDLRLSDRLLLMKRRCNTACIINTVITVPRDLFIHL